MQLTDRGWGRKGKKKEEDREMETGGCSQEGLCQTMGGSITHLCGCSCKQPWVGPTGPLSEVNNNIYPLEKQDINRKVISQEKTHTHVICENPGLRPA